MTYKHYLLLLPFWAAVLNGMQFDDGSVFKPGDCSKLKLIHENKQFFTDIDGNKRKIEPAFIDKRLRNIDTNTLKKAIAANCYLKLNKLDESRSEFALKLRERAPGGGPWFGALTAITGTLATAAAATGTFIVLLPTNPAGATLGAAACAKGGMSATAYATMYATSAPTP
ncbi:MAG: hypothetical protein ACOC80_11350 [Petrotogales bacterium]